MKTSGLWNVLFIVVSVIHTLAAGISTKDKKLETNACECANTGNGGTVECIFIPGMDMTVEGNHYTRSVRACRYGDGHYTWNIARGTGNKMKIILGRCVMCYKCLEEGMECLVMPSGQPCPKEMPPMGHGK